MLYASQLAIYILFNIDSKKHIRSSKRKYTYTDKKLHCLLIELVSLHVKQEGRTIKLCFQWQIKFPCIAHLDPCYYYHSWASNGRACYVSKCCSSSVSMLGGWYQLLRRLKFACNWSWLATMIYLGGVLYPWLSVPNDKLQLCPVSDEKIILGTHIAPVCCRYFITSTSICRWTRQVIHVLCYGLNHNNKPNVMSACHSVSSVPKEGPYFSSSWFWGISWADAVIQNCPHNHRALKPSFALEWCP